MDSIQHLTRGRLYVPLAEVAEGLLGISARAAVERHRRGTLGVRVEQVKRSNGKRGSAYLVHVGEVRRLAAKQTLTCP